MPKGAYVRDTEKFEYGRPILRPAEPGQIFGQLTVLRETRVPTKRRPKGSRAAVCRCECGNEVTVLVSNLYLRTTSCGCLQRQRAAESNRRRATHGLTGHPHFPRWQNMIARCENPADPHYPSWGGRGIRVCDAWHDVGVFIEYLEMHLGPRPEGHSLDRIDNDGHYEPGNVRWADSLVQRHNQRRSL